MQKIFICRRSGTFMFDSGRGRRKAWGMRRVKERKWSSEWMRLHRMIEPMIMNWKSWWFGWFRGSAKGFCLWGDVCMSRIGFCISWKMEKFQLKYLVKTIFAIFLPSQQLQVISSKPFLLQLIFPWNERAVPSNQSYTYSETFSIMKAQSRNKKASK